MLNQNIVFSGVVCMNFAVFMILNGRVAMI